MLFRLWRGKGTASQVRLAADLLELLVQAFPGREVHGTGDAAFHGEPLVIEGTTCTTRLPANAVLSRAEASADRETRPAAREGRPDRHLRATLPPHWHWTRDRIRIYGKDEQVQAAARPALWHGSFRRARPARPDARTGLEKTL